MIKRHLFSILISFSLATVALAQSPAPMIGELPSLTAIYLNRQGVKLLKEQKPEEALTKWSEALAHSPLTPEIHLNMGLAFEALGQPEKAIQAYQTAEKLAMCHDVQFLARFNQGALHQKAKRVDDALNAYHAALQVNPISRETKINIGLLIQQQQKDQQQQKEGQQNQDQQGGEGQNKDQQNQDPKKEDQKDPKDGKDEKSDKKKEDKPKEYAKNPKPQPRPFDTKEIPADVAKKILGELLNQEQRIRADYNKREVKEKPRDKDW